MCLHVDRCGGANRGAGGAIADCGIVGAGDGLPGRDNGHASIHGAGVRGTGVCERDAESELAQMGTATNGSRSAGL